MFSSVVRTDLQLSTRVTRTGQSALLMSVLTYCFKSADLRLTDDAITSVASVLCRDDCSFVLKREFTNRRMVM
jgi:hypothetical protein